MELIHTLWSTYSVTFFCSKEKDGIRKGGQLVTFSPMHAVQYTL